VRDLASLATIEQTANDAAPIIREIGLQLD
jgi:hypothetical protein